MNAHSKITLESWVLLTTLGLVWGASFMAVTVALEGQTPFWVAASRLALGAILLLIFAIVSGRGLPRLRQPQGPRIWGHLVLFAIFTNALPFTLLSWGQTYVPSAFAGVSMAAVPLITLPLAYLLIPGEQMGWWKTAGFCLGFLGVLALIGWESLRQLGADGQLLAKLACIGAGACYAIGSINTRLCPKVDTISFSAAGLALAAVLSVGVAWATDGAPDIPTGRAFWAAIYLGFGPTALATVLLVRVITTAGPSFMSLVNYQVPIWSVIFGLVILHEALPPGFLTALILIISGLALTQAAQRRLGRYPSG